MPRKRNPENKGLPARWRMIGSSYYYLVPPGQEALWNGKKTFRLGNNLPLAYEAWTQRSGPVQTTDLIHEIFDKYLIEVVPKKAAATQLRYRKAIDVLRPVFGQSRAGEILPYLVYQYVEKRSRKTTAIDPKGKERLYGGRTMARQEIAVLSHVLTKAVEWGKIHRHPFKGEVRLEGERPRTRYVEDWEIKEALSLKKLRKRGSVSLIQAYIKLKLLTGMAKGDLLRLEESDLKEDGIHNERHKTANSTGKRTVYLWTDDLRAVVKEIKAARPMHICPLLFCTRFGAGYYDERTGLSSGWDSMWRRFMNQVLKKTKVETRFTDHDLRAKCASDADSLEHARQMLAHVDSKTTNRIYRRKAELVQPARRKF
jgi:integrase